MKLGLTVRIVVQVNNYLYICEKNVKPKIGH